MGSCRNSFLLVWCSSSRDSSLIIKCNGSLACVGLGQRTDARAYGDYLGGNRHSIAGRMAKRMSLERRYLSRNGLCSFLVLRSNINW